MNLATWSIKNPVPSILLFVLLTINGIFGFSKINIKDLPDITFPIVNASISVPGVSALQLENEVAIKVENAISKIQYVRHITTELSEGNIEIAISFSLETDINDAINDTREAINSIQDDMPSNMETPRITAETVSSDPLMTISVSSQHMSEVDLSCLVDDKFSKQFMAIKGIGKFVRLGGVDREISILLDPIKLESFGVSSQDISQAISKAKIEQSSGYAYLDESKQPIITHSSVSSSQSLNHMTLLLPNGNSIELSQIAKVSDSISDKSQITTIDDRDGIIIEVYASKGVDEILTAQKVKDKVSELNDTYSDISIQVLLDKTVYTLEQYTGSMNMIYEGAFLSVIVVWLFLRDWRATLISSLALPLSIIPTFGIIYWLGFSLNTLTLLSLAIVIGILIDDAIVEIENIVRHRDKGKTILEATKDAVNEIALAVIATTGTIVFVFLPTSLMGGVIGLFFKQFGWTVVIAVTMSLLVARILTPLLAANLMKESKHSSKIIIADEPYSRFIRLCLLYRKRVIFSVLGLLVISFQLLDRMPFGFLPATDEGYISINIELPIGNTLKDTSAVSRMVKESIVNIEGIKNLYSIIGNNKSNSMDSIRRSEIVAVLKPKDERSTQSEIQTKIREKLHMIPGIKFSIRGAGPGESFSLVLTSDDSEALINASKRIESDLRKFDELSNVTSTANMMNKVIVVRPDSSLAASLGVTADELSDILRVSTSGDYTAQLPKLNTVNRQINIRTSHRREDLSYIDNLLNMPIPLPNGVTPLSNVANISVESEVMQIDRYDRSRYITISADLKDTPLSTVMAKALQLEGVKHLDPKVKIIETGETEMMGDIFSGFTIAMLAGVICVFCILVLLFNDVFKPIIIVSVIPLSFIGAFFSLWSTNTIVSLPALIGIIMLIGITTKNSILLVEYVKIAKENRNMNISDALVEACTQRARPIIMTTVAMIAGMLPIALGIGSDSNFRQPMGISVIGGLITSTVLSLIIVPIVHIYIDKIKNISYRI